MKKVLYMTNIEVPYKVKFFNELAKKCNLTVLYERKNSSNRDDKWANSVYKNYSVLCYDGLNIGNEFSFSLCALKCILKKYDVIILSCFNSPVQIVASLILKLIKRKFYFSFDGEIFIKDRGVKSWLKKTLIRGATLYLTAGDASSENLKKIVRDKVVVPYYFSSLTKNEIKENTMTTAPTERKDFILVIGQYFEYKGLDIAVEVVRMNPTIQYKFVGMGKRTELFIKEQRINEISNITVIPFLQKQQLYNEYRRAKAVLLPSRQECWGLVINEAASFGTPIISTRGSGAAVEFLGQEYAKYLVEPNDARQLYNAVTLLMQSDNKKYGEYLKNKSLDYTIEHMVNRHISVFRNEEKC